MHHLFCENRPIINLHRSRSFTIRAQQYQHLKNMLQSLHLRSKDQIKDPEHIRSYMITDYQWFLTLIDVSSQSLWPFVHQRSLSHWYLAVTKSQFVAHLDESSLDIYFQVRLWIKWLNFVKLYNGKKGLQLHSLIIDIFHSNCNTESNKRQGPHNRKYWW